MSVKISEQFARSLAPQSRGNLIVYDQVLKGFGLRVTSKGAKAFVLNYRINGRERRLTIGGYPEWTATAARNRAETLKREVDLGHDPLEERREERLAPSMDQLCDLYVERHLPKKGPGSARNDAAMIATIIRPQLGAIKVAAVRHRDIEGLHRKISARAPFRANRLVALLSKMFALSIRWDMRPDNPAKGIERTPERQRKRYLDEAELRRFIAAITEHPDQSIACAIWLLMLTGARKMEILAAKWDMFDTEKATWIRSHNKQKKEHRAPLSSAAIRILIRLKSERKNSPFLFPTCAKSGHLMDIKKSWKAICLRSNLGDFRIHDLRHTYASYIVSNQHSLEVIGALLGHSQAQTTHRYAHLLDDPQRAATEQAGAIFHALVPDR